VATINPKVKAVKNAAQKIQGTGSRKEAAELSVAGAATKSKKRALPIRLNNFWSEWKDILLDPSP
jgi:hypothetical protein